MSVIYIVIPLAFGFAIAALAGFIWATRTGQFDDLSTTAVRAIHDDDPAPKR